MRIEKLVHAQLKGMRMQRVYRQGKHTYWSQHPRENSLLVASLVYRARRLPFKSLHGTFV